MPRQDAASPPGPEAPAPAEPSPGSTLRRLAAALIPVQAVICALLGYRYIFTGFSPWDDEGYMLIGTRLFVSGRALFDDIFTQYGPFSYLIKWAFHRSTGLPVGHDIGRFFTLAYWLIAAAGCAVAISRSARSPIAALVTFFLVFETLRLIVFGPSHPQDLCAALLGVAAMLPTFAAPGRRLSLVVFGLGTIGGLLITTRINVGVFLLMALGATLFILGPRTRGFRAAGLLYLAAMLAAPVILIGPLVLDASFAYLLWIEMVAIASCALVVLGSEWPVIFAPRHFLVAGAGLFVSVALVAIATGLRGTSAAGVVDGIFLRGARNSLSFLGRMDIEKAAWAAPVAAFSLASAIAILPKIQRGAIGLHISALARLVVGILILALSLRLRAPGDYARLLAVGPSFAFLALSPPRAEGQGPAGPVARVFLTILAVTEFLWVFPVAGDQRAFAAFLSVAVAVLYLTDAIAFYEHLYFCGRSPLRGRLLTSARLVVALAAVAIPARTLYLENLKSPNLVALDLPGARRVRLPAGQVKTLRAVTAALRRCPDTFVSLPGLNSFYLWAEREPPTGLNLSNWMFFLTDAQQRGVISTLRRRPRIVALIDPSMMEFWLSNKDASVVSRSPLARYILREYQPTERFGEYLFCEPLNVQSGRSETLPEGDDRRQ